MQEKELSNLAKCHTENRPQCDKVMYIEGLGIIMYRRFMIIILFIALLLLGGCKGDSSVEQNSLDVQVSDSESELTDDSPELDQELADEGQVDGVLVKEEDFVESIEDNEPQTANVNEFIDIEEYQFVDLLNIDGIVDSINGMRYIGETSEHKYFLVGGNQIQVIESDMTLSTGRVLGTINNKWSLWHDNVDVIEDSTLYNQTVIRSNNKSSYDVYTLDMELIEAVEVPEVINQQIDHNLFRDWDVSDDFSMFTYSRDDLGLFIYDVATEELTHIADNSYDPANADDRAKMEEGDIMDHPTFIMDDKYISTIRYGYEWVAGYNLYNVESSNFTSFDGAVELTLYEDRGCYVYWDDSNKLTYYDFSKDVRIERGVEGEFPLSDYNQGYNYLIGDKVVSLNYDYEKNIYTVVMFDLVTKDKKVIGSISRLNRSIGGPSILYCDLERIYILIPWENDESYAISMDLNMNTVVLTPVVSLRVDMERFGFNRFTYNGTTYDRQGEESVDVSVLENVILDAGESIELEFINVNSYDNKHLQVIDNRISPDKTKSLNYLKSKDYSIYEETTNHEIVEIISQRVRDYEVSKSGIIYNGFGDEFYCSYFDFESKTSVDLEEDRWSYDIDTSEGFVVNGTHDEIISYVKNDTITQVARLAISELVDIVDMQIDDTYTLELIESQGREYVVACFNTAKKVFILDANSLDVIKSFDGRWAYAHDDGVVYYSSGIFVLAYDIANDHTSVLYAGGNPQIINIIEDQLLCSVSIDAYPEFENIDINTNIMKEYEDYDYIVFEQFWNIHSNAYLFDQVKSEFITLGEWTMGIEYELNDLSLSYRYMDRNDVWQDIVEYELVDGYSVKIVQQ